MEQKSSKEKNEKEKEKEKQNELNEILKKNEFFIAQQKLSEEEIEKLKKESEDKKEQIKTKTNPELFELVINELKDYLKSQEQTAEIVKDKQNGGISDKKKMKNRKRIKKLEKENRDLRTERTNKKKELKELLKTNETIEERKRIYKEKKR